MVSSLGLAIEREEKQVSQNAKKPTVIDLDGGRFCRQGENCLERTLFISVLHRLLELTDQLLERRRALTVALIVRLALFYQGFQQRPLFSCLRANFGRQSIENSIHTGFVARESKRAHQLTSFTRRATKSIQNWRLLLNVLAKRFPIKLQIQRFLLLNKL